MAHSVRAQPNRRLAGIDPIQSEAQPESAGERPGRVVDAGALYAHGDKIGLCYGPGFQRAERVIVEDAHNSFVRLAPADAALGARAAQGVLIDPAWLDSAIHGLLPLPIGVVVA